MGAIITKIGLEKIANATVNEPLRLETFAVGDGNGKKIIPNNEMKSLVNEKYRDLISSKYTNGNNTIFESVIKATAKIDEGFYIRELGLFDEAGDLIVITDVPVQYRLPTTGGNAITELLFNVTVQVSDTSVIEIKINEQVFATADSVKRILNRVEILESNSKKLIESSVGIDKWFNTDNKYKDKNLITIGLKTYALMDESNILKIADYPLLFKNINGVDRGDGTFAMPKFYDGTTRHLSKGSVRDLGTYQEDAMQRMVGRFRITVNDFPLTEDVFYASNKPYAQNSRGGSEGVLDVNYHFDSARVVRTDIETRMKNTGGQWYLLAKIDI